MDPRTVGLRKFQVCEDGRQNIRHRSLRPTFRRIFTIVKYPRESTHDSAKARSTCFRVRSGKTTVWQIVHGTDRSTPCKSKTSYARPRKTRYNSLPFKSVHAESRTHGMNVSEADAIYKTRQRPIMSPTQSSHVSRPFPPISSASCWCRPIALRACPSCPR